MRPRIRHILGPLTALGVLVLGAPLSQAQSSNPWNPWGFNLLGEDPGPLGRTLGPRLGPFPGGPETAELGIDLPLITPLSILRSPALPGSDARCLTLLSAEGVSWQEAPPREGIATPVTVPGDRIAGVSYRFYYRGRAPRVMDCRLALALARAGGVLRNLGVTEVIFANHYRPSLGKLKRGDYHHHALGLAIDIKGFRVGKDVVLDVARDYERGLGFQDQESCLGRPITPRGMLLRKIVCDLDEADVFQAILTPDYDSVHWHHFHFSAFHPADPSRYRPRGTALIEMPIDALPSWALRRSARHQPERRSWDAVAIRAWPVAYQWIRARWGLTEPAAFDPNGSEADFLGLGGLADAWRGAMLDAAARALDEAPAELLELLQNAARDSQHPDDL